MILTKDITFTSFLPPVLVKAPAGQTYVCPGWHKVPENITLKEVHERWVQHVPKGESKPDALISETVMSSSGNGGYTVNFDGNYWSCTCPGFGFRRSCRHLTEVQSKHK